MTELAQEKERGRLRQFWTVWRGWVLLALFVLAVMALLAALGWLGVIETGLGQYIPDPTITPAPQPERAKTLWDWMDLLLVPMALALGAAFFTWVTNRRERKAEESRAEERQAIADRRARERQKLQDGRTKEQREIESDRAREAALQTYLDRIGELLLNHGLGESKQGDNVRDIARARTLTVLRQLDGERMGLLLRFLYESELIGKRTGPVGKGDRKEATVALDGADLGGAYLYGANLVGADLGGADLDGADLDGANLAGANLFGAYLGGANLFDAELRGADLIGADLGGANLKGAKVTDEQLAVTISRRGATMPDGTEYAGETETSPAGTILRAARERAGLTRKALAEQAGVSRSTVGRWERKSTIPRSAEVRAKVAEVLGIDPWVEIGQERER